MWLFFTNLTHKLLMKFVCQHIQKCFMIATLYVDLNLYPFYQKNKILEQSTFWGAKYCTGSLLDTMFLSNWIQYIIQIGEILWIYKIFN